MVYIQIPSIKNCTIDKTSCVSQKSNLLDTHIGRYTYVGRNNGICNAIIGSFCSIGSFVSIGGGIHPINRLSTSPLFYDKNNIFGERKFLSEDFNECEQLLTKIGNDVWIGDYTYIKAGVTIGDGAVIGAGTVVTHDVPAYSVVAGVPGRVIKYRFSEDIINHLLKEQWWNCSDDELISIKDKFKSEYKI